MKRGATTQHIFRLPADVPLEGLQKIAILYTQKTSTVIRKDIEEVETDPEKNTLTVVLSESETLRMRTGKAAMELILKYETGEVLRSHVYPIRIEDTLLDKEV